MYIFKKRFIGIYLDPTLACNLQCRMCYFSKGKKNIANKIDIDAYNKIANTLFYRALKLQIGCGAEPTLHKHLPEMIRIAKQKAIPFVSITTNGMLLTNDNGLYLQQLAEAGLDELIISLHGTQKNTYENLMTNAKFDNFLLLLGHIANVQTHFPNFNVRINYTINQDNFLELQYLSTLFDNVKISTLQVRPIQDLGDSAYNNFDLQTIIKNYEEVFDVLVEWTTKKRIMFLYPTKKNLATLTKKVESSNIDLQQFTYIYVRPDLIWQHDFNIDKDNFDTYCKRTKYVKRILKTLLGYKQQSSGNTVTIPLNYEVKK